MVNEILLLSGNDIPFFSAKINVHQPTIKEISFIGEENFFTGCQLLNFSKEILSKEDKNHLSEIDDFDILMSIINSKEAAMQKIAVFMALALFFPEHTINIDDNGIVFEKDGSKSYLNKDNFNEFREIISSIYSIKGSKEQEFNPANEAARKIAEKLKKGREMVAKAKGKDKKYSLLSLYVSVLSIGLKLDINTLLNYTFYQLQDQFKRFQMYQAFDINVKARLAGATDLDEVENWMEPFHS